MPEERPEVATKLPAGGSPYFPPPDDYRGPSHCRTCLEHVVFVPVLGGYRWVHTGLFRPHPVDPGRWWDTLTGTWQTGDWSPFRRESTEPEPIYEIEARERLAEQRAQDDPDYLGERGYVQ